MVFKRGFRLVRWQGMVWRACAASFQPLRRILANPGPIIASSQLFTRHRRILAVVEKNQALKMLPGGGSKISGKQFCGILFGVKVFTFMAVLLGHDESGPILGLKLLVGPRWREFHCRRGAGMKFSQRISNRFLF